MGTTKYLAQIDVDRAVLEERWDGPETFQDDFAEWFLYAFSPAEGEVFILHREVHHPPAPGYILSVSRSLFSEEAVGRIVKALDIDTARVTHMNAEVCE
ncbi:hypothetical protein [Streptomyces liangshanensis]|uniref:hypothetical protein n=1 Tax=Streptomyces liangshanensis TaxID=2717324 RepID=UPI0036DEAF32